MEAGKRQGWADAHCHLADPRPGFDADAAILDARGRGVSLFVQGGVCAEDWARQLDWERRYPGEVIPVAGVHPVWVAEHSDAEVGTELRRWEAARAEGRFRGVGELGLDFRKPYAGTEQRVRQEAAFRAQVQGARKHRLPAVLHVVRAHSQVLDLLREEGPLPGSGIVHSFSGGPREAQAYAELGLYLSVSGGTFRAGTEPFARVARAVPRDRWLVETDAPDQCHASWPGPWSKPAQVVEVAAFLAASLGDGATPEQVLDHSAAQIRRLFPV